MKRRMEEISWIGRKQIKTRLESWRVCPAHNKYDKVKICFQAGMMQTFLLRLLIDLGRWAKASLASSFALLGPVDGPTCTPAGKPCVVKPGPPIDIQLCSCQLARHKVSLVLIWGLPLLVFIVHCGQLKKNKHIYFTQ